MTSPAETTLRLLQQLYDRERVGSSAAATAEPDGGQAGPQVLVSPVQMLQALVATDFDLPAAMVRLRRDL